MIGNKRSTHFVQFIPVCFKLFLKKEVRMKCPFFPGFLQLFQKINT